MIKNSENPQKYKNAPQKYKKNTVLVVGYWGVAFFQVEWIFFGLYFFKRL
jgi:hypothetical protein